MSAYKTVCADVEVSLDEWQEKEIIDYMEDIGYTLVKSPEDDAWLTRLADAKVYHPEQFDKMFSEYIHQKLGRIV
jgi:hypothetical protein